MSKKVKGSNGYIIAELTTEEDKRSRVGDEYFIGILGRIDESRILSYHCNICNKDFEYAPKITFETLGKDVEGVTLREEGSYICKECNSIIATYKIFRYADVNNGDEEEKISLNKFLGMSVFDDKARMIGNVDNVYLSNNRLILSVKKDNNIEDLPWDKIIAIKDIVLVKSISSMCSACNYLNKEGAKFCEQCGTKL
ncbi:MAG: zinc-ribbon domain-containing protein [Candidatus Nitrosocaldaceae archaeon]